MPVQTPGSAAAVLDESHAKFLMTFPCTLVAVAVPAVSFSSGARPKEWESSPTG